MDSKLLLLVLLIKTVAAGISLDLNIDNGVKASFNGAETNLITDEDIKTFKIGHQYLLTALEKFIGHRPKSIDLRKDFNMYNLTQVMRVLSIKSTRLKSSIKHPIVVMAQGFENSSNHTIKMNAGISHSVANTLTTKWSKEREFEVSQDIEYSLNLYVASFDGTTSFSYTNTWGEEEEKSQTETIGSASGMEVELKPGDAVRAVLSAYAGVLEIEVVHMVSLTGCICYDWQGDRWIMPIDTVMNAGGIKNEVTTIETIKFNYYVESNLKVYDTKTGLLLL